MSYRSKMLYLAVVCGVSGFLVFTLFEGRQRHETAEPPASVAAPPAPPTPQAKQARPTPASAAHTAFQPKHPMASVGAGPIGQPAEALPSQDAVAMQADSAGRDGCAHCVERIAAFLDDPLQDVADKIALGRALMQSGTQAETLRLVNAILYAHLRQESDLRDGLMQALADAQTPESTAALLRVITDSAADLDFQHLPEELQYAIRKALRLNPDGAMTGRMLAAQYTAPHCPRLPRSLRMSSIPSWSPSWQRKPTKVGIWHELST